ncbi:hypothetical protein ACWTU6_30120 [Mesorhizobium sp. BHbsci]
MAAHYDSAVLPTRPRRPRDKSKVENGVRFAQSCILRRLAQSVFLLAGWGQCGHCPGTRSHQRPRQPWHTDPDHMPSSHRRYLEWTPEHFRRWAASIGPQTEGLVIAILANRPHPEQGFRTCLGILRLCRDIDPSRAEVCRRALSRLVA